MTIIKNLTPHALVLLAEDEDGAITGTVGFGRGARTAQFRQVAELPSKGVARATTSVEVAGAVEVAGKQISITKTVFGGTQDLPVPVDGTRLVVSLVTASAARAEGRTTDDLLVVGEAVRDADGKIIGCVGFGAV